MQWREEGGSRYQGKVVEMGERVMSSDVWFGGNHNHRRITTNPTQLELGSIGGVQSKRKRERFFFLFLLAADNWWFVRVKDQRLS